MKYAGRVEYLHDNSNLMNVWIFNKKKKKIMTSRSAPRSGVVFSCVCAIWTLRFYQHDNNNNTESHNNDWTKSGNIAAKEHGKYGSRKITKIWNSILRRKWKEKQRSKASKLGTANTEEFRSCRPLILSHKSKIFILSLVFQWSQKEI